MGLHFVKRSTLPVAVKGKVGTLSVGISQNGQIQLTKLAMEWLGNPAHVGMAADDLKDGKYKVYILKPTAPILAKAKVEEKDLCIVSKPKKGNGGFFSGAAILRSADVFNGTLYDFKESGNQGFTPTMDEKNQALTFELPSGAVPKRPTVARVKKPKLATGVAAETSSTSGTPVGQDGEEELSLDAA